MGGHIILFEHINFHGAHKHVFDEEPNLAAADDSFFNDKVSSFVVLEGTWRFFQHINYVNPYPGVFGPGTYAWVQDFGIQNDQLSSLKSK